MAHEENMKQWIKEIILIASYCSILLYCCSLSLICYDSLSLSLCAVLCFFLSLTPSLSSQQMHIHITEPLTIDRNERKKKYYEKEINFQRRSRCAFVWSEWASFSLRSPLIYIYIYIDLDRWFFYFQRISIKVAEEQQNINNNFFLQILHYFIDQLLIDLNLNF